MNKLAALKKYCDMQAYDVGLWMIPETAAEDYVLRELRRLVNLIEVSSVQEIQFAIEDYKKRLEIE